MQLSIMRSASAESPDTVEFRLIGSIDLSTRQMLLDATSEALETAKTLMIDAGGVDFVDSVGLGALITVSQRAEQAGARFVITRQSATLQRVVTFAGLDANWHGAPHRGAGVVDGVTS